MTLLCSVRPVSLSLLSDLHVFVDNKYHGVQMFSKWEVGYGGSKHERLSE